MAPNPSYHILEISKEEHGVHTSSEDQWEQLEEFPESAAVPLKQPLFPQTRIFQQLQ